MERGDFATAVAAFEAYLDETSEPAYRPRAYYQLARAQYDLGEFSQTLKTLDQMEREFPDQRWPQTAALRGNAEYAMGKRTAAFLSWETAWDRGNEGDQAALYERMKGAVSEMSPSELRELDELVTIPEVRTILEARQPGAVEFPAKVAEPAALPRGPAASQRTRTPKAVTATAPEPAYEPDEALTGARAEPTELEPIETEPLQPAAGSQSRLGALLPLTGFERAVGQQALRGLRLALADAPETLVVRDTGSDPHLAARLFSALASDRTVLAIIARLGSAEAVAVAPLADQLRIPLLLLSHDTGGGGRFVIPLTADPMQQQVRALVGYAIDTLRAERMGALYADDGYGRAFVKLLGDEAQRRGRVIVVVKAYTPGKSKFAAEVTEVERWTKQGRLDALVLLDPTETSITLGAALRASLPALTLLGTEGWNNPMRLAEIGERAEGVVFADAGDGGSPRLREDAGEAPTAGETQAFDSALLARQAIASGVTTREGALSELIRGGTSGGAQAPRATAAVRLLRIHEGKVEPIARAMGGQ